MIMKRLGAAMYELEARLHTLRVPTLIRGARRMRRRSSRADFGAHDPARESHGPTRVATSSARQR